jgi:hypothetical protein
VVLMAVRQLLTASSVACSSSQVASAEGEKPYTAMFYWTYQAKQLQPGIMLARLANTHLFLNPSLLWLASVISIALAACH